MVSFFNASLLAVDCDYQLRHHKSFSSIRVLLYFCTELACCYLCSPISVHQSSFTNLCSPILVHQSLVIVIGYRVNGLGKVVLVSVLIEQFPYSIRDQIYEFPYSLSSQFSGFVAEIRAIRCRNDSI